MRDYVIVTDSTADLPFDIYEKLGIEVIPMEYILGGKTYHHYADAREMGFTEFYDHIKNGEMASTTQINYFTYETVFKPILESGKDILYIAFSSGLSGTYQSSKVVIADLNKKYSSGRIVAVDSLSASIGEGVLVYQAALKKESGMELDELAEWTKENRLNACHWFVVDDLQHLKQGGRITAVQATLGTALNLKPMLSVDAKGKLVSVSKIRGAKRIVEAFMERFRSDADNLNNHTVIVGHADNLSLAEKIAERLKELGLAEEVIISDIGPIIGTHVGAGMAALAFMGDRNL